MNKRKLLFKKGVNDANYPVITYKNKKQLICPYYLRWKIMITRCYSLSTQEKSPTYKGCTVSDDWLYFSKFKSWMEKQDWKGKELDKDLLIQGNKLYSENTCVFISKYLNSFLTNRKAARGDLPLGVRINNGLYTARCSKYGSSVTIGTFKTPLQASEAYKEFKYKLIKEEALLHDEPIRSALLNFRVEGDTETRT